MPEHHLPRPGSFDLRTETDGPAATARLGEAVAGLLRGGEIILLYGALGAGKTCFAQGLCAGLAVAEDVVSPTFTLINTYHGRLTVHHLDFYRIDAAADLDDIGVPDVLDEVWDDGAVLIAEWPDPLLPVLGRAPRLELLAVPSGTSDDRTWHLRGAPGIPPDWATLFGAGEDPASC